MEMTETPWRGISPDGIVDHAFPAFGMLAQLRRRLGVNRSIARRSPHGGALYGRSIRYKRAKFA
jgi:hypothetical protein